MPLEPQPKLFILVRRDLTVSQQAVQACHALAQLSLTANVTEWIQNNGEDHRYFDWVSGDGPLAILGVADQDELLRFAELLTDADIEHEIFKESSMNGESTALAVMPGADQWYFRNLWLL